MVSNKNKGKQLKIKNYNMNHFGNDWGLFVDIENQKINFPNNHEILSEKYNIQFCNYYNEIEKIDIHENNENNENNKKYINQIIKVTTTTSIIFMITFIVIFVL